MECVKTKRLHTIGACQWGFIALPAGLHKKKIQRGGFFSRKQLFVSILNIPPELDKIQNKDKKTISKSLLCIGFCSLRAVEGKKMTSSKNKGFPAWLLLRSAVRRAAVRRDVLRDVVRRDVVLRGAVRPAAIRRGAVRRAVRIMVFTAALQGLVLFFPAAAIAEKEREGAAPKAQALEHSSSPPPHSFSLRALAAKGQASLGKGRSFKLPSFKDEPQQKRKKLNLRDVRPPYSSRVYYTPGTDEAELESLYNEEIRHLFQIIKKTKNPDLLFRLGSLYVEKGRFISYKLQGDYEQRMEEFEAGKRKAKPRLNLRAANVYNRKALKLFEKFLQSNPGHSKRDEVLFFLGFAAYQLGKEEKGASYFALLEKEFPRSLQLYTARFQMADHYFKKGDWAKAYAYYKKVSLSRRGKFYFLSLYQMAWCSYKMVQPAKALRELARTIRSGRRASGRKFTFVQEAERDLPLFYTYSGKKASAAPAYFESLLGRESALHALKKLAYSYRDSGSSKGAVYLFSWMMSKAPLSPLSGEYKHQIIKILYETQGFNKLFRHLREWAADYGSGSAWARAQPKEQAQSAAALMEKTLRIWTLRNHENFRKTKNEKSKNLALKFYKLYFKSFQNFSDAHAMRFFYGELLFSGGKYKAASAQYEQVIVKHPAGKYVSAAYMNQLLALEKLLPPAHQARRLRKTLGKGPIPFPSSIKDFVRSASRYLTKFPKQKNSPAALFRIASFHYNYQQWDAAVIEFRKLFDTYPASPEAGDAGGVLLDLYNRKKDYKSLAALAEIFSKRKNADPKLLDEARSILRQLSFKKAQDKALQGKFQESAALYERFAKKNPSGKLAEGAFFNAGVQYEKAKNIQKAIDMYSAVLRYSSSSKSARAALEFLPPLYEKSGFYQKAAKGYSAFAKARPGHKKSLPYLYNAGVIYGAFNRVEAAEAAYQEYYARSRSPDRFETLYLRALLYERNRRWEEAVRFYNLFIQSGPGKGGAAERLKKVRSAFKISEIYLKRLKDTSKSQAWKRKTVQLQKQLRAGASYAAAAQFDLVRKHYDAFAGIGIPKNPAQMKKAVDRKIALLRRLENVLKPVIRYDDGEWITASLSLMGRAQEKMASALLEAPLPKGLDKKGLAQYKAGVRQLASPYIQAALKSFHLALEKSRKLKVHSEWTHAARLGTERIRTDSKGVFVKFVKPPLDGEMRSLSPVVDRSFLSSPRGSIAGRFAQRESSEEGRASAGRVPAAAPPAPSPLPPLLKEARKGLLQALKQGRERDMLKAVSQILNQKPKDFQALSALHVFYLQQRRWGASDLIAQRILALNHLQKSAAGRARRASILNNMAVTAWRRGEVKEALSTFKRALTLSPGLFSAKVNMAVLFLQVKNYPIAHHYLKGAYKKALRLWGEEDERVWKIWNNYGLALMGKGRSDKAFEIFDKLSRRPSPPKEVLFNKALALTRMKGGKFRHEAKGLVGELSFQSKSSRWERKLNRLLAVIREDQK